MADKCTFVIILLKIQVCRNAHQLRTWVKKSARARASTRARTAARVKIWVLGCADWVQTFEAVHLVAVQGKGLQTDTFGVSVIPLIRVSHTGGTLEYLISSESSDDQDRRSFSAVFYLGRSINHVVLSCFDKSFSLLPPKVNPSKSFCFHLQDLSLRTLHWQTHYLVPGISWSNLFDDVCVRVHRTDHDLFYQIA